MLPSVLLWWRSYLMLVVCETLCFRAADRNKSRFIVWADWSTLLCCLDAIMGWCHISKVSGNKFCQEKVNFLYECQVLLHLHSFPLPNFILGKKKEHISVHLSSLLDLLLFFSDMKGWSKHPSLQIIPKLRCSEMGHGFPCTTYNRRYTNTWKERYDCQLALSLF